MQADGGGTNVVLDDDRDADLELERVAQREVGPAEVDGKGHVAALRVDAAGDADADRLEVVSLEAGGAEGLVEAGGDGRDGAALVTHGGGVGSATEDGAVGVDDERGDLGATDIDTGDGTAWSLWPSEIRDPCRCAGGRRDAHRCTVSPSSRVSSSAQAPRSVTSSPMPPSSIVVSRPVAARLRWVASSRTASQPGLAERR